MSTQDDTVSRPTVAGRGGRRRPVDASRPYYADQAGWGPADFYALWRYFDRLFQYIGPTQKLQDALDHPDRLSASDQLRVEPVAKLQARRTGTRDAELSSLDLGRMSADTRYLMKHMLIQMGRYDLALAWFENLRGLDGVGELGHPLHLDAKPRYTHDHLTQVGIYL